MKEEEGGVLAQVSQNLVPENSSRSLEHGGLNVKYPVSNMDQQLDKNTNFISFHKNQDFQANL